MVLEKEPFIEYYAKQTKNENTSLFLGAGISSSAGYPAWSKLLAPCAKQLGIALNDSTDLYLLAQYYANQFGYSALKRMINENINLLNHESTLVENLLNLNFSTIWTTNYDTVIERNLNKRNILVNNVYNDQDLANVSRNNRVNIYKLNGDISNLDKIVITQNDIDKYEPNHELMLTFFKKELVSSTCLFLGYSFTDTVVLSCLNMINRCLGDSANYHFAIMKDKNTADFKYFIEDLEKRYHIKILLIKEHEELPEILNELNYSIKKNNIFFSGVFERLPESADIFAENLCKNLTQKLFENSYRIYTGYGRNFGNYLSGSSIQFLLQNNMQIDKNLVMRPFLKTMTLSEKNTHREMLISDCRVAIFMYGQTPQGDQYKNSRGMIEEFNVAKKLGKVVVPVGATGFTAHEIWLDVKQNITKYPYLERYIENLNKPDSNIISNTIIKILEETSEHKY